MNCVRCGVQLEANARFCRNCGLPVAASQSQHVLVSPPNEQATDNTIPISSLAEQLNAQTSYPQQPYRQQQPLVIPQQPYQQQQTPMSPQEATTRPAAQSPGSTFYSSPPPSQSPLNFYSSQDANRGARAAVVNAPRRRNRVGCILGCLGALVILLLLLGATWIFALRPYVHDVALSQVDTMMTNAVNQIPAVGLPIPTGTMLPVSEDTLNNVLASNASNSGIVQGANVQITANQVLLDLKIYGQDSTITTVPQMQDGKLVATHVAVSGIASLFLSSKDITTLLNSHLEDAQTRINHRVTKVQLIDHEIDVTVG